jgi:hypothetical protein
MMNQKLLIGVDLDNTLACYDGLFHRAGLEEGLISEATPASKEQIRDSIRLLPDGEQLWTRLQAIVYGPRMNQATLFKGAADFLKSCTANQVRAVIVSHKTRTARLDGKDVDLRASALGWMKQSGFFSELGLQPADVFFESTRAEKIERIRTLGCTHFIDDLTEVFGEESFPKKIRKFLFAPHSPLGTNSVLADVHPCRSWTELHSLFFP